MNSSVLLNPLIGHDIICLIGRTPIVSVHHELVPKGKKLMLKMESFNPNFSIKDRTALGLVQKAFFRGGLASRCG